MSKEKISPYKTFTEWLLNPCPDFVLSDDTMKAINFKSVLCMFGKIPSITIFIDKYFNCFDVMSLKAIDFYNFLRQLVQKSKFGRYDFSYFPIMNRDKTLNEIQIKLPHLKKNEISYLLEKCKEDSECESFFENLGINKPSKVNKVKKRIITTFDDTMIEKIKTMEDWRNCFTI